MKYGDHFMFNGVEHIKVKFDYLEKFTMIGAIVALRLSDYEIVTIPKKNLLKSEKIAKSSNEGETK